MRPGYLKQARPVNDQISNNFLCPAQWIRQYGDSGAQQAAESRQRGRKFAWSGLLQH